MNILTLSIGGGKEKVNWSTITNNDVKTVKGKSTIVLELYRLNWYFSLRLYGCCQFSM